MSWCAQSRDCARGPTNPSALCLVLVCFYIKVGAHSFTFLYVSALADRAHAGEQPLKNAQQPL